MAPNELLSRPRKSNAPRLKKHGYLFKGCGSVNNYEKCCHSSRAMPGLPYFPISIVCSILKSFLTSTLQYRYCDFISWQNCFCIKERAEESTSTQEYYDSNTFQTMGTWLIVTARTTITLKVAITFFRVYQQGKDRHAKFTVH